MGELTAETLSEWLHDLPPNMVDSVRRTDTVDAPPLFEVSMPGGVTTVSLKGPSHVLITAESALPAGATAPEPFPIAVALQAVRAGSAVSGPEEELFLDHDGRTYLLRQHRYAGGCSKHDINTAVMRLYRAVVFATSYWPVAAAIHHSLVDESR
jgi:hemin uptake protein HemP